MGQYPGSPSTSGHPGAIGRLRPATEGPCGQLDEMPFVVADVHPLLRLPVVPQCPNSLALIPRCVLSSLKSFYEPAFRQNTLRGTNFSMPVILALCKVFSLAKEAL